MEMVFLQHETASLLSIETGFNPCFDGNGLLAIGGNIDVCQAVGVSILVLMEMVFLQNRSN